MEIIVEERISLVCGRNHPFYGAAVVQPDELKGQPFATLTAENPTGADRARLSGPLGVNVEPVVSTDNVETVKKMVEVGMGVAFLPDMVTADDVTCKATPGLLDAGPTWSNLP